METIKRKLPYDINLFFNDLTQYLGTKLLYYGSVQRADFFPGYSDIDVDIFTDNVESTVNKMQHFLHVKNSDFKKIVWRYSKNNKIIYGKKIQYTNSNIGLIVEFSIYNNIYKNYVLEHHKLKTILPLYATIFLWIIKKLYYHFNILDKKTYGYFKGIILSHGIGAPNEQFLVLDIK